MLVDYLRIHGDSGSQYSCGQMYICKWSILSQCIRWLLGQKHGSISNKTIKGTWQYTSWFCGTRITCRSSSTVNSFLSIKPLFWFIQSKYVNSACVTWGSQKIRIRTECYWIDCCDSRVIIHNSSYDQHLRLTVEFLDETHVEEHHQQRYALGWLFPMRQ